MSAEIKCHLKERRRPNKTSRVQQPKVHRKKGIKRFIEGKLAAVKIKEKGPERLSV